MTSRSKAGDHFRAKTRLQRSRSTLACLLVVCLGLPTLLGGSQGADAVTQGNVSTWAGGDTPAVTSGLGTAIDQQPINVKIVGSDLYVADGLTNSINKIHIADGYQSRVSGTGQAGLVQGTGTASLFSNPNGMAYSNPYVYVADTNNNVIRRVGTGTGVSTIFAGSATGDAGLVDGQGTSARFNHPTGVASDSSGNLYVADTLNDVIRKIDTAGNVTTVVGGGPASGYGESVSALSAYTPRPLGVTIASSSNNIIFTDGLNRVRKLTISTGKVTTIAGDTTASFAAGDTDGAAGTSRLRRPTAVQITSAGDTFVADSGNNKIKKITSGGTTTTIAGSINGYSDAAPLSAQFSYPTGINTNDGLTIYVSDTGNNRVRVIDLTGGTVTTMGGTGVGAWSGDGGLATKARLSVPQQIASANGSTYVADTGNNRIRKISPNGTISTIAGSTNYPADGTGAALSSAAFAAPQGVAAASDGTVYVADTQNNKIKKIDTGGNVTTIAGTGAVVATYNGNGTTPVTATTQNLSSPSQLALDSSGNLFFTEPPTHRVRKLNLSGGTIVDVIGTGTAGTPVDGATASTSAINTPVGLGVQAGSNAVYIVLQGTNQIVRVFSNVVNVTSTVTAGDNVRSVAIDWKSNIYYSADAGKGSSGPGTKVVKIPIVGGANAVIANTSLLSTAPQEDVAATGAALSSGVSMAISPEGHLDVLDSANARIRRIASATPATTPAPQLQQDNVTVTVNSTTTINLTSNDTTIAGSIDNSTLVLLTNNATITGSGTISYVAGATATTDVVKYRVCTTVNTCEIGVANITVLDGPSGFKVTPGDSQVTLSFNNPTSATIYIFRSAANDPSTVPASPIANTVGASYTDATAVNGSTYTYKVAFNADMSRSAPKQVATPMAATAYSSAVMADSPVAYWRLDEQALVDVNDNNTGGSYLLGDSSGNGFTAFAPYPTGPNKSQTPPAQLAGDSAMQLRASGDTFQSPYGMPLNGSTRTVELWFKKDPGTGRSASVLKDGDGTNGYALRKAFRSSSGFNVLQNTQDATNQVSGSAMDDVFDSQWHQIAVVMNGTNEYLYIDGLQRRADTFQNGFGIIAANNRLTLNVANAYYDDVSVYNTALSAARIQAHFVAPTEPTNLTANPSGASVSLAWSAGGNSPTGYKVYRDGTFLANVTAPSTSFVDSMPQAGMTYTYTVTSTGPGSESRKSVPASTSGDISAFAGTGTGAYAGQNVTATSAQIKQPNQIAVDRYGNVYEADTGNHRVRKIDIYGVITTIAGTGVPGWSGDGRLAMGSELSSPTGVAVDPTTGTVYIADTGNHRVRYIDPVTGQLNTFVGNGSTGIVADGLAGTSTTLDSPVAVAVNSAGVLYVADSARNAVYAVTNNIVTVFAGQPGVAPPVNSGSSNFGQAATTEYLSSPKGLAVTTDGRVFIANTGYHRVDYVGTDNKLYRVAGNDYASSTNNFAAATASSLSSPTAVAVDSANNVYIAQAGSFVVSKVDATGTSVATIAGTGASGSSGNGGTALSATFTSLAGLAILPNGTLLVADNGGNVVRAITKVAPATNAAPTLVPDTVTSTGANASLNVLANDVDLDGTLDNNSVTITSTPTHGTTSISGGAITYTPLAGWVGPDTLTYRACDNSGACALGQFSILTTGNTTVLMGDGSATSNGEGSQSTAASTNSPNATWTDSSGNVYIAEGGGNQVRKISTTGVVTRLAGTGGAGFSGDGTPASGAQLNNPSAILGDNNGNLYIADTGNNRIRKIDTSGNINTVAGNGTAAYAGNGVAGTTGSLNAPQGLAMDANGVLFIADTGNNRIRTLGTDGKIRDNVGDGTTTYVDGLRATSVHLNAPKGLFIAPDKSMYIANSGANNILRDFSYDSNIYAVAGTGSSGFAGDGGLALAAQLQGPTGVAVDAAGNIFVADNTNHRVRRIDAAGTISSIAGTGTSTFAQATGPTSSVNMDTYGVGLNGGNVLVADKSNNRLRSLGPLAAQDLLKASSLTQRRLDNSTVAVGAWTNSTTLRFQADLAYDPGTSGAQACVEIKAIGTSFDGTGATCGTAVATGATTISVDVPMASYAGQSVHWRMRTVDSSSRTTNWVSFGNNAESAADVRFDFVAPTGSINNGTTLGANVAFNDGTLTNLSATWSVSDAVSGLSAVTYSIGTTAGGADVVAVTPTVAATTVSLTTLNLHTQQNYYVTLVATDAAGNSTTFAAPPVQVAPVLNFVTSFAAGGTALDLGTLLPNTASTATLNLSVTTNAQAGYSVSLRGTLPSSNGYTLANVASSYASPAAWTGSTTGIGYTSSDAMAFGANRFQAATCPGGGSKTGAGCYAPINTTVTGDIVFDDTTPVTGATASITVQAQAPALAPAGGYSGQLVLSAIPNF